MASHTGRQARHPDLNPHFQHYMTAMTGNKALSDWVADVARHTQPERIHWCDGSETEYQRLVTAMLANGIFKELNPKTHPNCYLHRSNPTDVARVEHLTFICRDRKSTRLNSSH